jgi:hypothetical protein
VPSITHSSVADLDTPTPESIAEQERATVEAAIRSQIGRLGALSSWAKTENRSARTAPARRKMLERFEREVDPGNQLTPAERAKRAEFAREAHFTRLAMKSAQARRRRAGV